MLKGNRDKGLTEDRNVVKNALNVDVPVLRRQGGDECFRIRPEGDQSKPRQCCVRKNSFNRKSFCHESRADMATV